MSYSAWLSYINLQHHRFRWDLQLKCFSFLFLPHSKLWEFQAVWKQACSWCWHISLPDEKSAGHCLVHQSERQILFFFLSALYRVISKIYRFTKSSPGRKTWLTMGTLYQQTWIWALTLLLGCKIVINKMMVSLYFTMELPIRCNLWEYLLIFSHIWIREY